MAVIKLKNIADALDESFDEWEQYYKYKALIEKARLWCEERELEYEE